MRLCVLCVCVPVCVHVSVRACTHTHLPHAPQVGRALPNVLLLLMASWQLSLASWLLNSSLRHHHHNHHVINITTAWHPSLPCPRYLYVAVIYNVCYAVALFWMLLFYVGTHDLLQVRRSLKQQGCVPVVCVCVCVCFFFCCSAFVHRGTDPPML